MDAKTLAEIGAVVTSFEEEFEASASVELSDGYWRSSGGKYRVSFRIVDGADADAAIRAGHEYVKALFAETRGQEIKELIALKPAPQAPQKPQEPPSAPKTAPGAPEPVRVPLDASGNETLVLPISGVAHTLTQNGDDILKVFGKTAEYNCEKYGVTCWPEPLDAAGVEGWKDWPVCKGGAQGYAQENRFQMPGGLTQAIVALGPNKNGKIVPQKVTAFK